MELTKQQLDDLADRSLAASERVAVTCRLTSADHSLAFSELAGFPVHLKLENLQHTGSFKLRGATNRLLTLDEAALKAGCVVASSGNHGAASAYAMQKLGVTGRVFVPEHTSRVKVDAIQRYGAEIERFGTDGLDTELRAREYARENRLFYLSPYNDIEVIAGQGTIGIELLQQIPDLQTVFVAVGGGGLVSGVAAVLKAQNPEIRIIGCQPAASAVMARSVDAGSVLDLESDATLSDGTAGGIEQGALTFPICEALVDEFVLVDEREIALAMRQCIDLEHLLIEGAAGVALATLLRKRRTGMGRSAVILCGGNVSRETLLRVLGPEFDAPHG